jgi:hypothetical protein
MSSDAIVTIFGCSLGMTKSLNIIQKKNVWLSGHEPNLALLRMSFTRNQIHAEHSRERVEIEQVMFQHECWCSSDALFAEVR